MKINKIKCNLCGLDNNKILYKSNIKNKKASVEEYTSTVNEYATYHNIVKCNNCGLVFMNPRDNNVEKLYKDVVDKEYINTWKEREKTFKRHIDWIKKYKKKGKLLDIGCYAGIFPSVAKKNGFEVVGVEPSKWAARYASNKIKSKVYQGSWSDVSFKRNTFEVITIWDVIEHLEDPLGCLKKSYNWLKKNGILAVTTHDIESVLARLMGRKYPWLMRFHLYHFSPKTLSDMIKKAGFRDVKISYYSKVFSLKYLFSRIGLKTKSKIFKKISIPVWSGDMFMITARKI